MQAWSKPAGTGARAAAQFSIKHPDIYDIINLSSIIGMVNDNAV